MAKYDVSVEKILKIECRAVSGLITSLDREITDRVIDLLLRVKPEGHKVKIGRAHV